MAIPKLKIKEIEVECMRPHMQGAETERINLFLTIVRGPRGRRKLLGEAFTRQVYHPIIHFKVYHESDVQRLFVRFLQQLVHRGYRPIQFRELSKDDRWGTWTQCDLSEIDLSSLHRAANSELEIHEEAEQSPEYPPSNAPPPK